MPTSLADHYSVPPQVFEATGALDPVLDVDTRLFIDPSLLRVTTVAELQGSYEKVVDFFNDVLTVVGAISSPGDRMWREASKRLTFPEVPGLSIGYASKGTNGSGMGPGLRTKLLSSVWEVVRAGVSDPALFELVGIFEDGVGPDRISDMVAGVIASDLCRFTQRVCSDCGIPMEAHRIKQLGGEEDLPTNPRTGKPMILVPRQLLRDLPVANDYGDIRWIAEHNDILRHELNQLIGSSWKKRTVAEQKDKLKRDFIRFPEVLLDVIRAYKAEVPEQYDFSTDPAGEVIWYRTSRQMPEIAPLPLSLSTTPTLDEVEAVVLAICHQFRQLIENNQLAQLLYDSKGEPKHESAAQLLFFGIASAYCKANGLDLSPESDAGRGPVDFKVSQGAEAKVLVEAKLTSNKQLAHGFKSQLPIYQAAERAQRGIYLVIDNGRIGKARLDAFWRMVQDAGANAPRVIWVDGRRRASASRADE